MDVITIPARAVADPSLSPRAVRLLLALAGRAHQGVVDASNLSLATDALISTRTLRRLLAQLRDQGYIEWLSPGPRGGIPLRLLWLQPRESKPDAVTSEQWTELYEQLGDHEERLSAIESLGCHASQMGAT